jgi:hypothetical protein
MQQNYTHDADYVEWFASKNSGGFFSAQPL